MYSENQKLLLLLDEMNVSRVGIFKLLEKYSLSFDLIDLFINYENELKEFFDDRVVKNIKNLLTKLVLSAIICYCCRSAA